MSEREYFLWKTWSQASSLLLTGVHHLGYFDQGFFSLHVIIRLLPMVMNDYYKLLLIPPLLFTDHYWLFFILLVINVYHWLLLIMVINVDFTPHYDLSITWFSLLPNISNDLSSPQEQEEMQNPLVLHLLCFPTGLWLKFSEPDLKMKFSGLGLQLNIFGPGRLQQRLSRLWDKLLLLGIGLKTLMKAKAIQNSTGCFFCFPDLELSCFGWSSSGSSGSDSGSFGSSSGSDSQQRGWKGLGVSMSKYVLGTSMIGHPDLSMIPIPLILQWSSRCLS